VRASSTMTEYLLTFVSQLVVYGYLDKSILNSQEFTFLEMVDSFKFLFGAGKILASQEKQLVVKIIKLLKSHVD